jgi:hypothetical protein
MDGSYYVYYFMFLLFYTSGSYSPSASLLHNVRINSCFAVSVHFGAVFRINFLNFIQDKLGDPGCLRNLDCLCPWLKRTTYISCINLRTCEREFYDLNR